MLYVNKVPGRPLRGHVSVAWRKGGLSPPPCSRLLATIALHCCAALSGIRHGLTVAVRFDVVERDERDGEHGEHGGEHGERGKREVAGHFVLLVSS